MKDCLIIGPAYAFSYDDAVKLLIKKVLKVGIWVVHLTDNIACYWFATLQVNRPESKKLKLTKTYNENDYHGFDDYPAIESTSKDIPIDYPGLIAVPISFFKYYDYLPYEIVDGPVRPKLKGKTKFPRLIIRRKQL